MRHVAKAICLRAWDYSETSQILALLTRESGVVRVIAKGIKRPKSKSGGMVDLLAEGNMVYSQKNVSSLGTLVEFRESISRAALRRQGKSLAAGIYAVELAGEMLAEHDPHPDVYDLLSGTLRRLEGEACPVQAVLAWYQWRLLRFVGLLGGLTHCCACEEDVSHFAHHAGVFFSSRLGGLLCDGCEADEAEKHHVAPVALGAIASLLANEQGQRASLGETQAGQVNRLLHYHIVHQLGKALRSARYVLPREQI
ncbi:MAG: DNA repair protein RecO [Phycisphaerales bacterium]|nr:DNA repair protein RecO [Phycisphaerales bacterium]MBT7171535.1 DNA repair protein RecO [Phycisphaerales bacterium]